MAVGFPCPAQEAPERLTVLAAFPVLAAVTLLLAQPQQSTHGLARPRVLLRCGLPRTPAPWPCRGGGQSGGVTPLAALVVQTGPRRPLLLLPSWPRCLCGVAQEETLGFPFPAAWGWRKGPAAPYPPQSPAPVPCPSPSTGRGQQWERSPAGTCLGTGTGG